jgi:hypothetical protein
MTGQAATDDTALLELAINGVSEAIIRYTEREFIATAAATRTFEYLPSERGYLDLAPYELRTITSVTLGGETVTATTGLGDGGYVPLPRNKTRELTYTYLTLRGYYAVGSRDAIYSPLLGTRDVVIVGDWGMSAVPADVELACLIAVSDLYRNPEQVSTRGSGDFSITELAQSPGSEESLPPGARRLLDPFVRPKVA